ncbi:unnamed protein product [Ectocarpus sp. 6 AP-2014]
MVTDAREKLGDESVGSTDYFPPGFRAKLQFLDKQRASG